MKKYVVAAIAAPVLVWLGFIAIGKKRADEAGTAVFGQRGLFLPFQHGLLVESAAAGVVAAYLVAG